MTRPNLGTGRFGEGLQARDRVASRGIPHPLAQRTFGSRFGSDVAPNSTLAIGINAIVSPSRRDDPVPAAPTVHRVTIEHKDVPGVKHPDGHIVKRNYARVVVSPKESGGTFSYHAGIWEVRIKAPIGTVIFVQAEVEFWNGVLAAFERRPSRTAKSGQNPHPVAESYVHTRML